MARIEGPQSGEPDTDVLRQDAMSFLWELPVTPPERLPVDADLVSAFAKLLSYVGLTPQLNVPRSGDFQTEVAYFKRALIRISEALQNTTETQQIVELAKQRISAFTQLEIEEIMEEIVDALIVDTTDPAFRDKTKNRIKKLERKSGAPSRFSEQDEVRCLTQIIKDPHEAFRVAVTAGFRRLGAGAAQSKIRIS